MFKAIIARMKQGHRTMKYPDALPPAMPERFRGRPVLDSSKCVPNCEGCRVCPTGALTATDKTRIDLGKCLFCGRCSMECPNGSVQFTKDHRLAVRRRQDLVIDGQCEYPLAGALEDKTRRLFGRSLRLRQVSAGGCGACEADTNVLNTVGWDLGRFGVQFVASPRHADGLLITGAVPENMHLALMKTYEAVAAPKLVIVVGACAISGGPFADHAEVHNGASNLLPVDMYVPGCPPHPLTILDGILRLLGRRMAQ